MKENHELENHLSCLRQNTCPECGYKFLVTELDDFAKYCGACGKSWKLNGKNRKVNNEKRT